ncbi:MAG: hypothetical protein J6386_14605 [Candidatus Synoicihabitans palmerolidicus]|nr:hypothetical protein [Candidatus Synoicihabitans palmerolidicus]
MTDLLHDLITAFRQLRRAPGFTLLAGGLLAVDLGATVATYSLFYSRCRNASSSCAPPTHPRPLIRKAYPPPEGVSATDRRDFQDRSQSFSELDGYRPHFASYTPINGEPAQWITSLERVPFTLILERGQESRFLSEFPATNGGCRRIADAI